MIEGTITRERMEKWKFTSPEAKGFHPVILPGIADCQQIYLYRLNLDAKETLLLNPSLLSHDEGLKNIPLEMNAVCISGSAEIENQVFCEIAEKLDSFYITSGAVTTITARKDHTVFYIGGALDEGYGTPYFRKFDPSLPVGDIHQIHGQGVGQREVFMTCGPEVNASRIEAGITWSGNGSWTSWPPHQHEKELEEVYCYFDMDAPHFGMQLSYIEPGEIHNAVAHTVCSGSMILAPRGYHPTVASPGTKNAYFWFMAAHSHETRRYDLAVADPLRQDFN